MRDHGHTIIKCKHCDKVIAQCRCMSKDKNIEYQVCDDCKLKGSKND